MSVCVTLTHFGFWAGTASSIMAALTAARASLPALLLTLALAHAAPPAPMANPATSVLLTDAVASHGARCLDGTPQRYWLQQPAAGSANASKWVFDFMGGGWCEDLQSCAARGYGFSCFIGSSRPECLARQAPGDGIPGVQFNETMDFADIPSCLGSRWCGGLFNSDPTVNPLTHDWNKVLVSYCDGGSYAGDNATSTTVEFNGSDVELWFRGRANVQAILDDLKANHGLAGASDVLLTGNSAGGLAVYWGADRLAAALAPARVVAVPDSGFFFTTAMNEGWRGALRWVVGQMDALGGLNQRCVAALASDPASCAFPEVAAPFISTPLFVMNSMHDPALDSISAGIGQGNATAVNAVGRELVDLVHATVMSRDGNAAFLTACAQHCGQWSPGPVPPPYFQDFNVSIDSCKYFSTAHLPHHQPPLSNPSRLQHRRAHRGRH